MTGKGHPFIKNPAYGASKAGIVSLARYFTPAGDAAESGSTFSPGGVSSRQDPEFQRKAATPSSDTRIVREAAGCLVGKHAAEQDEQAGAGTLVPTIVGG